MVKPIILVGGKSRRFGSDKFFLKVKGNTIFKRTYTILKSVFVEEPVFVGRLSLMPHYEFYPDLIPNIGPIGGLYTALKIFSCDYVFLVACDMPFIKRELLLYMFNNLDYSKEVYIPKLSNGYIEPLFAFYSRRLLPKIEENIGKGMFKLSYLIEESKTQYLSPNEINKFDPEFYTFLNINTKSDYYKIMDILSYDEKISDI